MLRERIFRYPETVPVSSNLDPISDVISWTQRLRSSSYTSDLLRQTHGMSTKQDVDIATKTIRVHIDSAIALLEQAFVSKTQVSYLPFFYAIANLSKIMIISQGQQNALDKQKLHGASWQGINSKPRHLLNDHILIMQKGVVPLFYKAITQQVMPVNKNVAAKKRDAARIVYMKDVYGYIIDVGFEYRELAGERPISIVSVFTEKEAANCAVEVSLNHGANLNIFDRRKYQILRGLKKIDDTTFRSEISSEAKTIERLPRHLIYESNAGGAPFFTPVTYTPVSASPMLLPQELPIYLAFYHLSNVVRYHPERMYQYFDGEEVSLLIALSRHGIYRFLLLFWSYMTKTNYRITHA